MKLLVVVLILSVIGVRGRYFRDEKTTPKPNTCLGKIYDAAKFSCCPAAGLYDPFHKVCCRGHILSKIECGEEKINPCFQKCCNGEKYFDFDEKCCYGKLIDVNHNCRKPRKPRH